MLNEQTRKSLKSLITVGNAAIVRYPWTTVLQKNKSIIAFVNIEELGEEPLEEFGLEDNLSEFLSIIDFYKSPEISAEGNLVTIQSGKNTQRYETSDLDSMRSYDVPVSAIEKVQGTPEIISFEITSSEIARFKKLASLTKSTSFIVNSKEDGESSIIVCKLDRNNNMSNDSVTNFEMSASESIRVEFDIQNIAKLPEKDYSVSIKKSGTTGNGVSMWTVTDEPIQIVVSVNNLF